jgi:hypothetical protein
VLEAVVRDTASALLADKAPSSGDLQAAMSLLEAWPDREAALAWLTPRVEQAWAAGEEDGSLAVLGRALKLAGEKVPDAWAPGEGSLFARVVTRSVPFFPKAWELCCRPLLKESDWPQALAAIAHVDDVPSCLAVMAPPPSAELAGLVASLDFGARTAGLATACAPWLKRECPICETAALARTGNDWDLTLAADRLLVALGETSALPRLVLSVAGAPNAAYRPGPHWDLLLSPATIDAESDSWARLASLSGPCPPDLDVEKARQRPRQWVRFFATENAAEQLGSVGVPLLLILLRDTADIAVPAVLAKPALRAALEEVRSEDHADPDICAIAAIPAVQVVAALAPMVEADVDVLVALAPGGGERPSTSGAAAAATLLARAWPADEVRKKLRAMFGPYAGMRPDVAHRVFAAVGDPRDVAGLPLEGADTAEAADALGAALARLPPDKAIPSWKSFLPGVLRARAARGGVSEDDFHQAIASLKGPAPWRDEVRAALRVAASGMEEKAIPGLARFDSILDPVVHGLSRYPWVLQPVSMSLDALGCELEASGELPPAPERSLDVTTYLLHELLGESLARWAWGVYEAIAVPEEAPTERVVQALVAWRLLLRGLRQPSSKGLLVGGKMISADQVSKGMDKVAAVLKGTDAFPEDAPGLEPVIERNLWQLSPVEAVIELCFWLLTPFTAVPAGAVEDAWTLDPATLAGQTLCTLMRVFPDQVRNRWADPARRKQQRSDLEKIVKVLSPSVVSAEVGECTRATPTVEDADVEVKYSRTTREMTVSFAKAEATVALIVGFPETFPLQFASMTPSAKGVPDGKLRQWLLGAKRLLETGAPQLAVSMWLDNVAGYFDGVEECPICYSVLHLTLKTLPRKPCPTCKYVFHSECIYKWFKTSQKSTCPLCQSPF